MNQLFTTTSVFVEHEASCCLRQLRARAGSEQQQQPQAAAGGDDEDGGTRRRQQRSRALHFLLTVIPYILPYGGGQRKGARWCGYN